jgi:hypothetical protein
MSMLFPLEIDQKKQMVQQWRQQQKLTAALLKKDCSGKEIEATTVYFC